MTSDPVEDIKTKDEEEHPDQDKQKKEEFLPYTKEKRKSKKDQSSDLYKMFVSVR